MLRQSRRIVCPHGDKTVQEAELPLRCPGRARRFAESGGREPELRYDLPLQEWGSRDATDPAAREPQIRRGPLPDGELQERDLCGELRAEGEAHRAVALQGEHAQPA